MEIIQQIIILIAYLVIYWFIVSIFTSNIINEKKKNIIILFLSVFLTIGTFFITNKVDKNQSVLWNNGHCSICGEEWELFDIEKNKHITIYYYKDCNGHILKK